MSTHRTGTLAAALALTAATTVAVAPAAHAAPSDPTTGTTTVQYVAQGTGSTSGSLDNELVQVGLVLIAGIGVSALLAIGAGVAGGGIEVPEIPGLPF